MVRHLLGRPDIHANVKDKYGRTRLHLACKNGHLEMVKPPIEMASILAYRPAADGYMRLLCSGGRGKYVETVNILLERPNVCADVKDLNGVTPLYLACRNGCTNIVNVLLARKDVHPDAPAHNGATPLHEAVRYGHANI